MKAIGLTCGIGSMLIGAGFAGFKVIGNIEWRPYYHTETFTKNFPKAFLTKNMEEDSPLWYHKEVELAMGHPECGNYSNLRTNEPKFDDPGDIPLFINMVKKIRPEFFVMDNLPGSLIAVPIKTYFEELSGYRLFPEWVSNYHYGNSQFFRRRFFLIGCKRGYDFVFRPGEFSHEKQLADVIGDLPDRRDIYKMNHVHRRDSEIIPTGWAAHQLRLKRKNNKITYGDLKRYIKDYPTGKNFQYVNLKGETKLRPGYCKIKLNHHSPVMTGGGSALDNHYRDDTLSPLTIRERARIQGCPDDFIFHPLDNMKDPRMYSCVYKQTGKFMPVEFCAYAAKQIFKYLSGDEQRSEGHRFINPNPYIDEAKRWLCSEGKYKGRGGLCEACWIGSCEIWPRKMVLLPQGIAPLARHKDPAPRQIRTPQEGPKTPKARARMVKIHQNF
jgi:site-specific DNA-cytosine methylase